MEGKWLPPGSDIEPALFLSHAIFNLDIDHIDPLAWQALALYEGTPVGTGRIWWEDGSFMLGFIGVLPKYRGRGFGDFLVRLLLFKAQQHNAVKIAMKASPVMTPFFQKYGFMPVDDQPTDGEQLLMLDGQSIVLDACLGCKRKDC